jgi:hypothetical protein
MCNSDLSPGVEWLASMSGTKYDYCNLFWHACKAWLGKLVGRFTPFKSKNKLFCTEANIKVAQKSEVPSSMKLRPEDMNPGQLLKYYNSSSDFEQVYVGDARKLYK